MVAAIGLRDDYDAGALRAAAKRSARRAGRERAPIGGPCGDLRPGRAAGRSRLGAQVHCARPGRPDRPQGAGAAAEVERRASGGAGCDPREQPDPGGSSRRAMADRRFDGEGVGLVEKDPMRVDGGRTW
jgi:hypothetical protein